MQEIIDKINSLGDAFHKDALAQATNGNKAAGLRARRVSLEMEPLLKQFRKLSLAAAK